MTKIIGLMPCRNSAWVLGLSARALLLWLDELVILNHCSTDDTSEIALVLQAEFGERVQCISERSPLWEEMRHRQKMLYLARQCGATHIVTIDDDEVLTGNLLPFARDLLDKTPAGSVLQLPWLAMRGGYDQVQVRGIWADQDVSVGFRDAPECHWAAREGYDFHHRHPMGRAQIPYKPVRTREHGLMHLQFSSERRLRAKQALYKLTEVLRWPGRDTIAAINRRYDYAVYDTGDTTQAREEWWAPYRHLMGHLDLDAEPWQESECRRLWAEHGAARFRGLDLFDVVK